MRIKHPEVGDFRDRHAFLFFPRTIDNETRWLEWASWSQQLLSGFDGEWTSNYWRDEYWIAPEFGEGIIDDR